MAYIGTTKKSIVVDGESFDQYGRGRMVKSALDLRLTRAVLPSGDLR